MELSPIFNSVEVCFYYIKKAFGVHPALHRQAAAWRDSLTGEEAVATAVSTQSSKEEWEADCVHAACIIASLTKGEVRVKGLDSLKYTGEHWPALLLKSSNRHMLPIVGCVWSQIVFEKEAPTDMQQVSNSLETILAEEVLPMKQQLDHHAALAVKVHAVIEESFQHFPVAASTAHSKGQRGGKRSPKVGVCAFRCLRPGSFGPEFRLLCLGFGSGGGSGTSFSSYGFSSYMNERRNSAPSLALCHFRAEA